MAGSAVLRGPGVVLAWVSIVSSHRCSGAIPAASCNRARVCSGTFHAVFSFFCIPPQTELLEDVAISLQQRLACGTQGVSAMDGEEKAFVPRQSPCVSGLGRTAVIPTASTRWQCLPTAASKARSRLLRGCGCAGRLLLTLGHICSAWQSPGYRPCKAAGSLYPFSLWPSHLQAPTCVPLLPPAAWNNFFFF